MNIPQLITPDFNKNDFIEVVVLFSGGRDSSLTACLFLKDGKKVHFYPEGSLWQYYTGIRPFKKGAFHMAIDAGVPIIPAVLVQRPCTGLRRIFRKKSLFKVIICPAVYADPALSGVRQVEELRDRTRKIMCNALEKDQYSLHMETEHEALYSDPEESTSMAKQHG